jgi:orotate phosphoribosyltransferase
MDNRHEFIRFALGAGVLRFGQFRTKAGRDSPYFFNAGLFDDGERLGRLAEFYAQRLLEAERLSGKRFDLLFGPAYKGITLASATAVALARAGRNIPFAYNRKEAKDHGEGGTLVGAPMRGEVVIIDDVISAGTSVRESVELIRAHGANPAAVLIALDRQERGGTADAPTGRSATQEVTALYDIPVHSIAALEDLLAFLELEGTQAGEHAQYRDAITAYRSRYGVAA